MTYQHRNNFQFCRVAISALILFISMAPIAYCRTEDRKFTDHKYHILSKLWHIGYDMNNLPFDLQPIREFIGLWQMDKSSGHFRDLPPPSLIDFAINPIPKFGARTVNIS